MILAEELKKKQQRSEGLVTCNLWAAKIFPNVERGRQSYSTSLAVVCGIRNCLFAYATYLLNFCKMSFKTSPSLYVILTMEKEIPTFNFLLFFSAIFSNSFKDQNVIWKHSYSFFPANWSLVFFQAEGLLEPCITIKETAELCNSLTRSPACLLFPTPSSSSSQ